MVEFQVEGAAKTVFPDFLEWTVKELNSMIEKAEKEESIPYQEFIAKYKL